MTQRESIKTHVSLILVVKNQITLLKTYSLKLCFSLPLLVGIRKESAMMKVIYGAEILFEC
jgi:hypothetical protein